MMALAIAALPFCYYFGKTRQINAKKDYRKNNVIIELLDKIQNTNRSAVALNRVN